MNILGIWDGHDSGAALVADGAIIAAVNEERFTRRKLEVRFPSASIDTCLRLAGVSPGQVDRVAAAGSDVAKTLARVVPQLKDRYYRVRRRQTEPGLLTGALKNAKYWLTELGPNPASRLLTRMALARELRRLALDPHRLAVYDHHECHAAGAAWTSGFDRAVVVTIDGVGDGRSATVSVYDGGGLRRIADTPARDSPGIFFEHVTNLMNMRELEDEGKVMALAHYAAAPTANPLTAILSADGLRFRTIVPGHSLRATLKRVHWCHSNEQFARMAQEALEQACVAVVRRAVQATGIDHVVLAGGVVSNIQVNRLIRLLPEVNDVFVFPHMGDGGLAVGAACAASIGAAGARPQRLGSLALGPSFDPATIRRALEGAGLCIQQPADLSAAVADLLMEERVVFWFQGAMEYGPRSLGQRSMLARPDRPAVRDRLNLVLKRRVWYQPFCPTLLESDARHLFDDWRGSPDRYMTMAYSVKPSCRPAMAAVVANDGTCRPQILPDDDPAPIAGVLRAMKQRTGLGAVLNTSFNIHGEPLVCSPAEAIDVFRRSGADALAIGPYLVRSEPGFAG